MKRQPRSLRSTLVEPFKQIKLGIYIIGISIGFIAIVGTLIVLAFMQQYEQLMEIFQVVSQDSQWELIQNSVFEANIIRIAIAMVIYITTLFVVIFWATHRFYGPLVSISRFVDSITDGDYSSRVSVRKRDELQDLVGKLNQMAETLQNRHGPSGTRERRDPNKSADRRAN